ncbi:MAG: bacterial transcriptional activator domain-containing protein [Actinomycetota bacterium]|nr:bacterial transcriptional activator domain-containing protein [Actinomycetota bacterium]
MDDTINLTLLGSFAFSVGGDPLPAISTDSQRLLAFLAVEDRSVPRARVARTLWPGSSDERAAARLSSAVAQLGNPVRRAVKISTADLGLAEGVAVDLSRSRSLARRLVDRDALPIWDDLGGPAVSALSNDLLPGWYDDWALMAAAQWHQLRLHALEAVAAHLTDADRLAEAAAAALAAVRAEPLRETARTALIRVRMAEGNDAEARAEFERYRVLLHDELGIEPTSRLRELHSSLETR